MFQRCVFYVRKFVNLTHAHILSNFILLTLPASKESLRIFQICLESLFRSIPNLKNSISWRGKHILKFKTHTHTYNRLIKDFQRNQQAIIYVYCSLLTIQGSCYMLSGKCCLTDSSGAFVNCHKTNRAKKPQLTTHLGVCGQGVPAGICCDKSRSSPHPRCHRCNRDLRVRTAHARGISPACGSCVSLSRKVQQD